MYYIHSIASISHQDSFQNPNIYQDLKELENESEVVSPNYKDYIPPASLRRLSPVLRMGLTASIECQNNVSGAFDAISVGTALGCLKDTEKFLNTFHTSTSDFLSPTAFIQSTHNTIGGQISLGLKNHAYNMTHTQNNLSFEVALLDALMCVNEGKDNVLVGAADERIDFLQTVQPSLIPSEFPLTSGASFFVLSPNPNDTGIGVRGVRTNFNTKNIGDEIDVFLRAHEITRNDLDIILHSDSIPFKTDTKKLNYLLYSGMHYSAPAFAMHIAHDYLKTELKSFALVVNNMCPGTLGLTLIEKQ